MKLFNDKNFFTNFETIIEFYLFKFNFDKIKKFSSCGKINDKYYNLFINQK